MLSYSQPQPQPNTPLDLTTTADQFHGRWHPSSLFGTKIVGLNQQFIDSFSQASHTPCLHRFSCRSKHQWHIPFKTWQIIRKVVMIRHVMVLTASIYISYTWCSQWAYQIFRCSFTTIGVPIIKIKRSGDHFITWFYHIFYPRYYIFSPTTFML